MRMSSRILTVWIAASAIALIPALAQTKPAESTTKVKKVLLYNKVGGWLSMSGFPQVQAAFSHLAAAKGFELVPLNEDALITLDYLKQFQVLVWNNNTDGGASVPSPAARQAVLDYLAQGGGWMLVCNAGNHLGTWPGLAEVMGTSISYNGKVGEAEVVLDGEAEKHPELKWMVAGLPKALTLDDAWWSFRKTVRALPGVTVVATARNLSGHNDVIIPTGDGSEDQVLIWAREVGLGRFLYTGLGFGSTPLMEQQDSIVPRTYWENLRYAAGDFQNGCMTPGQPGFDPAARVHDEAACPATRILKAPSAVSGTLTLSRGGMRIRLSVPEGAIRARLYDVRGTLVWERNLRTGTQAMELDDGITPGVYHFEAKGAEGEMSRPLALP